MGTFLKLLQIELLSLDQNDYYEPDADIRNDDNVAGELTDELLRLYSFWRILEKSAVEKVVEVKYGKVTDEQKKELTSKANELHDKAEVLKELFWVEIREEYSLWDKPGVGVRKGRRVVWYKIPKEMMRFGSDFGEEEG